LLTDVLKSVSRSFYLSLRVLPKKIRPVMGLAYLLCRTADTIADAEAIPSGERLTWLKRILSTVEAFPVPEETLKKFVRDLSYANLIPKTAEGKLLNRFEDCATLFQKLSRTEQA